MIRLISRVLRIGAITPVGWSGGFGELRVHDVAELGQKMPPIIAIAAIDRVIHDLRRGLPAEAIEAGKTAARRDGESAVGILMRAYNGTNASAGAVICRLRRGQETQLSAPPHDPPGYRTLDRPPDIGPRSRNRARPLNRENGHCSRAQSSPGGTDWRPPRS
jgi:hypothetical protein